MHDPMNHVQDLRSISRHRIVRSRKDPVIDIEAGTRSAIGVPCLFPGQFFYVVDHREGKVLHAQGFDDALGYPDMLVNMELIRSSWHPDDAPTLAQLSDNATRIMFEIEPPIQPFEISLMVDFRMRRFDRRYIKVLCQTSVFEVDTRTGRPITTLSICHDISSIKTSDSIGWQCTGRGAEALSIGKLIPSIPNLHYRPTCRELEVLRKLVDGKGSKEIASELNITFFTVNTHRRNLLERTGSKNTAELVTKGMAQGWL